MCLAFRALRGECRAPKEPVTRPHKKTPAPPAPPAPWAAPGEAIVAAAAPRWEACRAPLLAWFDAHARDLPWRAPLAPDDAARDPFAARLARPPRRPPYAVWISEIMLQQTVVAAVIPHFARWMRAFPDVRALADAAPEAVLRAWAGLGYYARARNLHKGARAVVARGAWPADAEEWRGIPGVGEYTAGAVASIALGQNAPILDGNIVRVFSRLAGLAFLPGDGAAHKKAYWDLARLWVAAPAAPPPSGGARRAAPADPLSRPGALNEALMELGALVCVPGAPRCGECPLAAACAARRHGWTGTLPPAKPRARIENVAAAAVLVRRARDGALLTERRGSGAFLAGHALFPLFLGEEAAAWREAFARRFPALRLAPSVAHAPGADAPVARVRHTIMSRRYEVEVWRAECLSSRPATSSPPPVQAASKETSATWIPPREVAETLTNALARKIWKAGGEPLSSQ